MNQKLIFFILCLIISGFSTQKLVLAITTTPSGTAKITPTVKSTPTPTASKQIEDLKDRLATKVAELKGRERKVVFGNIKSLTLTTMVIETLTKDLKIERTDEIVVYKTTKGNNAKYDSDTLSKGDAVVVFGYYDSTLDLLDANIIAVQTNSLKNVAGTVKEIDRSDFTLTVTDYKGFEIVVDIETTTKTNIVNPDAKIEKFGFSKIQAGDRVQVVGTPNIKEDNRISGLRILVVGSISSPTTTPTPAETPSVTPKTTPTP